MTNLTYDKRNAYQKCIIFFAYKPWKHENIDNGFGNQHAYTLGET